MYFFHFHSLKINDNVIVESNHFEDNFSLNELIKENELDYNYLTSVEVFYKGMYTRKNAAVLIKTITIE